MPIQGEIKTLYKNKNNTSPIFPTTKVKAVSDENGIGLDALLRDNYATKTYVTSEIAKAQVGGDGSEIDLSGFATKDYVDNIKHPISSVNNKTGEVILTAEDVGARPNTWMPTAEQVGAHPNTWLPTIAQIGAASIEQLNAQTESYLSHYVPFNAKTICFSIKGKNMGYDARQPITMHISSKMKYMGFIQFNVNMTDGAPIESAYMFYGNLPIVSFKYRTDGDTTTYLFESYGWNWWGSVEVKTHSQLTVTGLNDTTLDSGTEMTMVQGVTPEQIGAAPAGYGYGETLKVIEHSSEASFETLLNNELATMADKQSKQIAFSCSGGIKDGATFFGTLTKNVSAVAFLSGTTANGSQVLKRLEGGVWTPFEWVNPPMELGIEYRTTERYEGKPVYVRKVNAGLMPSAGHTSIPLSKLGIPSIPFNVTAWIIGDVEGYRAMPNKEDSYVIALNALTIASTETNDANRTAYFNLKYTKD